jgi:low affinity Fe/Cu permease
MSKSVSISKPANAAKRNNCVGIRGKFHLCAHWMAEAVGSPWAFIIATLVIIVWAATGPLFHFSDTWQLVVNTGTTVVTFLIVFLIQNTQNRDTKAVHLKLDELLRGVEGARTSLVNLENLSDEELEELQKEFEQLNQRLRKTKDRKANSNHPETSQAAKNKFGPGAPL